MGGAAVFRHYLTGTDAEGRSFLGRYVRLQLSFAAFAVGLCAVTWGASAALPGDGFPCLAARGLVASGGVLMLFRRDLHEVLAKLKAKTSRKTAASASA